MAALALTCTNKAPRPHGWGAFRRSGDDYVLVGAWSSTSHWVYSGRMTKRAVIYSRASLDATGEGRSVDRQEEQCRKLLDLRGWQEVEAVRDNSISAYGGKHRPGWEQVRQLMRSGRVDVIVAWHLDRITRSMLDLEQLIGEAETYGVAVATATGDIDLTTDVGRMVARILAAVARAEVERKAARQKLANEQLARAGKPWTGGARPFGYTQDQLDTVPEEAEAIREAAQAVLGGVALREIARRWDEAGLVSSRASDTTEAGWTGRGVRGVLLSPRYVGLRTYRGEVVGPGVWPAILDEDTYTAVGKRLTEAARTMGMSKAGRTPSNLLTGLVHCSVCGRALGASRLRGQEVYLCRPSAHVTPRRALIEDYVAEELLAMLSTPAWAAALAASGDDDVELAQTTLDALDEKLAELVDAYTTGTLDVVAYGAASAQLTSARQAAELALKRVDGTGVLEGLSVGTARIVEEWNRLPLERKRALIDRYLDVEVRQTGGRRVTWSAEEHLVVTPKMLVVG